MKTIDLTITEQELEVWIKEMTQMGVDRRVAKALVRGFIANDRDQLDEYMPKWIEFCICIIKADMSLIKIGQGTAYAQFNEKLDQFEIIEKERFN
jgi:hypothetical protein